jgi:hypothetical protein
MLNRFFSLTVSKFLITTGYAGGAFVTKSEIIDLSEVGKYQCSNWIDYPIDVYDATGGLLGSNAVVCGGEATDECYKITSEQAIKFGQMSTKRHAAASVTINSNTLWVTGGWDGNNRFSSTEFVYLNGAIQAGNSGCILLKMTSPKLDDPSVFKCNTACSHTFNALNFLYALYPKKLLRI